MQGVEVWNRWRKKNPAAEIDFSETWFRFNQINLYGANFTRVNLQGSDLRDADLSYADLSYADLSYANLSRATLYRANLSRATLHNTNLSGVNLYEANLYEANLYQAMLNGVQALKANFTNAIFTGACLQDWNINSETRLDKVICEYVYLSYRDGLRAGYYYQERRPSNPNQIFAPGEFTKLVQKAISTVDLIFADGINWQAFFQSFQELQQYDDLSIQAIEKKSGGAFVIRLEVPPEADKAAIESHAKELYEMKLQLQEQRYQAELQAKDGQISLYQEQLEFHRQNNTNLMEVVKTMAEKENQPTHQTIINAQTIGATHTGSGDITNFTQNINSNIDDITKLITALRDAAQTFPEAQREEALEHLGDVEEGIRQPDKVKPHRVKAALAALLAIAGMVAATTDFSNNVLEIGNKLGIELIQPHSK
nr:pentapeptide repeat-containing protein [Leptolyngbya sp. FACHB-1624]